METNNIGLTLDSILKETRKAAGSMGSNQRFDLPLAADQLADQLAVAYAAGVARRGRTFEKDERTAGMIRKVAAWLTNPALKPMLMLAGDVGTGKTEMARTILAVVNNLRNGALKLEHEQGSSRTTFQDNPEQARIFDRLVKLPVPKMCTAQQLVTLVADEDDGYQRAKRAAFLIVDDLGAEPASIKVFGADKFPLIDLITERYDAMLTTVFTSNLNPDGIASHYGGRVSDRLNEVCERIICQGASYRN